MSSDTEQEEIVPVIVDCDVLEAAKENIQPLAKGRRVTALSAILSTPHAQRESRLAATRNRLRMNVDLALDNSTPNEEDEEDESTDTEDADPLEAYCQYIYWVVENYPQGHSAESGLLELLEEATRVLKDHQGGKWRGDLRYLKLWVLYASYVEKPAIIFKFCMVNEIGTSHALLYEEFAVALERSGRKTQADETYRIGIARKATPVERLESKYKDFQKRMMASPKLPSPEEQSDSNAPSSTIPVASTRRKALGETASSRTTRTTRASARAGSATPSSTPTIPQPSTRSQANARLQVFVDPSPEVAAASETINEEDETSPWTDLGTRKSRIKENVKEATKAAGTTLRQTGRTHRSVPSQSTSKISVYRDPAPAEVEDILQDDDRPHEAPSPPALAASSKAKAGKSIAVFRDEEHEAAPATKKSKYSTKSSIPVFRDVSAASTTPAMSAKPSKTKSTSKSPIAVFRDDAEAPRSIKGKTAGKGTIAVFRDEDPEAENEPIVEPKARSSKSKSSIAVFRDEPTAEASSSTKPPKGKLAVFRDPEASSASSETKKPNGKIPVFRDEPDTFDTATPAAKAKGKMLVFRDEEPPRSFTPYRDEEIPKSPTSGAAALGRTKSGTGVGLGIAGLGPTSGKMSSEAEALRKDPLKNYSEDVKVFGFD